MDYQNLIKESAEELIRLEQSQKHAMLRDRIRFVKLLKTGQQKSQRLAGEQIGLKER